MNVKMLWNRCSKFRQALALLAADALPAGERAALEQHLGDCSRCQQAFAELQSVANTLAAARDVAPKTEPSSKLRARWVAALKRAEHRDAEPLRAPSVFEWLMVDHRLRWAGMAAFWAIVLYLNVSAPDLPQTNPARTEIPMEQIVQFLRTAPGQLSKLAERNEGVGPSAPAEPRPRSEYRRESRLS